MKRKKITQRDRMGRAQSSFEEEEDDGSPFDANGILRDGHKVRIPLYVADSARASAPGSLVMYDVPPSRAAADSQPTFDASLHRPGWRTGVVVDAAAEQRLAAAYAEYDAYMNSRWCSDQQTKPAGVYPLSAGEGSQYMTNGQDDRLVREDNWLVCKPNRSRDAMPITGDVATIARAHAERMQALYDEVDRLDAERWRNGK